MGRCRVIYASTPAAMILETSDGAGQSRYGLSTDPSHVRILEDRMRRSIPRSVSELFAAGNEGTA